MAQRRMFSKTITNSDLFSDMPVSSQLLYFHLGMNADDDGFVESRMVMKQFGSNVDDLSVLLVKGFVLQFEDKVIVIRDWKINNEIRADRYKPTFYLNHKARLSTGENHQYSFNKTLVLPNNNQKTTVGLPSIGKDRLGKDSIGNNKQNNSKNSLLPLSNGDRNKIAIELRVDPAEVARIERQVLNPENIRKYKYKTTYYTVKKWIDRQISRKEIQTLDENGMMVLKTLYGGQNE